MYIIVGLGNPGEQYKFSRHNVGFSVIEQIGKRYNIRMNKLKFRGIAGQGIIQGQRAVLVKPQTYMNNSGRCVLEILKWYKIAPEKLIVIYDDMDLTAGRIRIRKKGSAGGHKGMKSIIYMLQTDEFPRIRVGIGQPDENEEVVDYVLSKFRLGEHKLMEQAVEKAVYAVETIIASGIETSMNRYN